MIDLDQVIKQVAKNLNIDRELASVVCKHVFQQTVEVMKSDDDYRDILFNQLFKFKLKRRYKENKTYKYSSK
jgi:hypothetical protein